MKKVLHIHEYEDEYHVVCPTCGKTDWKIIVDDEDVNPDTLQGFRCIHCGFQGQWTELLEIK